MPSNDVAVPSPADDGPQRTRLVVLYGGRSAEHDISRVTARHVLAAVDPGRYEVVPVAITREGRWVLADDVVAALGAGTAELPESLPATGSEVTPSGVVAHEPGEVVVVLPLLHGPMGEDGTVQGLLELADVAYVGCGVLSSAMAMDKGVAKEVLAHHGIPQARWRTLHDSEVTTAALASVAAELGLPLFVKPANMGSSIGISKVTEADGLAGAVALALTYDDHVVIEESVEGREIECAVLGHHDDPRASLPGEILPAADFYDFEDKYGQDGAELRIPATLPPDAVAELQDLARRTFRALRCEGMARVDVFYEAGGRGFLVNEVNTIPGFTPISMYPKMWEASGLTYAELIDELVRLALERHARRRRRTDPG